MTTTESESLDVLLLLDDQTEFGGRTEGNETFLFVSEVIEALEPALVRLGHRSRRLSFAVGARALVEHLISDTPDVVFLLGQPVPTDFSSEVDAVGLLELLRIPHTSELPEALILTHDKGLAKAICAHHGIPTPASAISESGALPDVLPPGPWIAKPTLEDGSLGLECSPIAHERHTLGDRVRTLYERFDQPILIESFVEGREFQVGFVGSEMLPLLEIDFSRLPEDRPHMIGYEMKWKYDSVEFQSLRELCPAPVSGALGEALRDVGRRTARAFRLDRCCRLDIRMDDRGGLHVLDVNPNPDLSPVATMHTMATAAGWGFDGLVQRLLDVARNSGARPATGDRHPRRQGGGS